MSLLPHVLALGDDALVLGHRLSEWSSRAPSLEEDIALSNLGLDLIGQARLFYGYAAEIEGNGRTEDHYAFFREAPEFRNLLLVEQPRGDFAFAMVRQLFYSAMVHPYFERLARSRDRRLSEIAAKAVKEMAYHVRHAGEWVIRLGDGTEESRRRAVVALGVAADYVDELFEPAEGELQLVAAGVLPDRGASRAEWQATVGQVLSQATLALPVAAVTRRGGRSGTHGQELVAMLAEMQSLARAHPGATW